MQKKNMENELEKTRKSNISPQGDFAKDADYAVDAAVFS